MKYIITQIACLLLSEIVFLTSRAVARSENPGVPVLFGGHNRSRLVEIGLTDLPKSGGSIPGTTPLLMELFHITFCYNYLSKGFLARQV